jgi:hypothetical protein
VLPSAVTPAQVAREQLHVALLSAGSFTQKLSVSACPAFDPSAPEEKERISSVDGQFTLEQSDIPSVSEFCVSAWLDVNRNGSIDAGDAMGQLAKEKSAAGIWGTNTASQATPGAGASRPAPPAAGGSASNDLADLLG